jgi:hypothetical protein
MVLSHPFKAAFLAQVFFLLLVSTIIVVELCFLLNKSCNTDADSFQGPML